MNNRIIYCVVVLLTLIASAHAERKVEFSLKPTIGFLSGYTKFVMDVRSQFGDGIIGGLKSELDYPLGTTMAGFQFTVGPNARIKDEWGIEASYLTNLNDPGKVMKDYDWISVPGQFSGGVGYTESRSTMTSTQLSLEAFKAVLWSPKAAAGLIGGFKYQKINQEIYGYNGWYVYLDTLTGLPINGVQEPANGSGLALTYQVTYKMPMVGVFGRVTPFQATDVMAKLEFAPVWAKDIDDHVLRNRVATSSGTGKAFIAGLRFHINPFAEQSFRHVFLQADVDYFSLTVKTTGDQRWYGSQGDMPAGTYYTAIPHSFYSRQLTTSARVGITF